jgi:hypothetical protein
MEPGRRYLVTFRRQRSGERLVSKSPLRRLHITMRKENGG